MENISQRRNVIVGTAGHVDHGKTWLIKALTGVDTDRLKEEQKRGITIEPGFAQMQNENNVNIGIIDVPGHEKFIKNMLAGIGGIDIVLLVIAADEGIMPQTREHFEIISMLDIKHGVVVITKTDLVDEDWLEIVQDDIRDYVKGTFLEQAPMVEVSAYTGKNITMLKDIILQMAVDIDERRDMPELFRLPVDRVFTMDGFGTVVTGTLIEGSVSVGDEVEIYPQGITAKVRNIRIHGKSAEKAVAGQRTAINLTGIRKEEVSRGNVIAYRGALKKSRMVDVKINIFDSATRILKNGDRLHFYYGSAGALCKAILLDKENLSAGETGFAQLRLEEEIAVRKGDRFILRFYSPLETLGGGIILDANPQKRKRFSESALSGLGIKEAGDDADVMEQTILEESKQQTPFAQIAGKLDKTYEEAHELASVLADQGKVVIFADGIVLHKNYLNHALTNIKEVLSQYHKNNPISIGMKKEEVRNKLEQLLYLKDKKVSGLLLRHFVKEKNIRDDGTTFAMPDFTISYSKENEEMKEKILTRYVQAGFAPDSADSMIATEKNKDTARQIVEQMAQEGRLEKIASGQYVDRQAWDKAVEMMRDLMGTSGSMKLAEFRDALGTSRKYAILLLEAFDERGMTKLEGEVRIPGPSFRE